MAGAGVRADQQPAPYPAAFWINGTLDPGATGLTATDLAGFDVYVYSQANNYLQAYGKGTTQTGGVFSVNAIEDLQMNPITAKTYYIGVVAKTVNNTSYGVNQTDLPVVQADVDSGYKNLTAKFLTLAAGQGITTEVDTGLYISRKADLPGSSLDISWDPIKIKSPTIYAMTGDGTGKYEKDNANNVWTVLVNDMGMVVVPGGTYNGGKVTAGTNGFTHENQVGAGAPEEYYKAVAKTVPPTPFADAPAVGKMDKTVYGAGTGGAKYNFISTPFTATNDDLAKTFTTQIEKARIEVFGFNNLAQKYDHAAYSTKWDIPILINRGLAYWIYNPLANDIPITVVGNVPANDKGYSTTFYKGAFYNDFALPQCWSGLLKDKGLGAAKGAEVFKFDNKSQYYQHAVYDGVNKDWSLVDLDGKGTMGALKMEIGGGLWYYNATSNDVTFNP